MELTGLVVMVKDAVEAPPGTVTDAGTWAADVLLLNRVTRAPPSGAGPLRIRVPVEGLPPTTVSGLRPMELKVAVDNVTVNAAD